MISPEYRSLRTEWTIDDTSFNSYVAMVRFQNGEALGCIEQKIGKSALHSVLDLAGGTNGRAVQDLIEAGYVGKGAFTNLIDRRADPTIQSNIGFVAGDLTNDSTWRNISRLQSSLAPEGFTLVLHRPYGALQDLSVSQYVEGARRTLDLMQHAGVLFAQIPGSYAYARTDPRLRQLLRQRIQDLPDVEAVEESLDRATLADHAFFLIHKN